MWSVFRDSACKKWVSGKKGVKEKKRKTLSPALTSQHRPSFLLRKSLFLKPSLWSLWPALPFFSSLRQICYVLKILCFSIETCLLRRDIDVSFHAGVMIWWIRISKPRDNTLIHACFFSLSLSLCQTLFFPRLSFSPQVQILISQMNTNIYSADVCGGVTSESFQTIKVFVGAAGCNAAFGRFLLPPSWAHTAHRGRKYYIWTHLFPLWITVHVWLVWKVCALSEKSQLFWICMTLLCKLCTYPRF